MFMSLGFKETRGHTPRRRRVGDIFVVFNSLEPELPDANEVDPPLP
jgi:hypothetical protein